MNFDIRLLAQNHNRIYWCGRVLGNSSAGRWKFKSLADFPNNHYSFKFEEDFDYFMLIWKSYD